MHRIKIECFVKAAFSTVRITMCLVQGAQQEKQIWGRACIADMRFAEGDGVGVAAGVGQFARLVEQGCERCCGDL